MKTKQKILNAALKILVENGLQGMTQTRIAEVAGVSQGHLTYHFPKKYDLLTAVVDESKSRMSEALTSIPKKELTLNTFADTISEVVINKFFPRLMLALTTAAEDDPSLAEWFVETEAVTRKKMHGLMNAMGMQVDDLALIRLRAALMGASLMHLQQNTESSAKIVRDVIRSELQYLSDHAKPFAMPSSKLN